MWWISRGYSPAAVECWNAIRGIDYLTTRTEVDAGRIAATGLSGGGAVTFWISAVDDRIKVAAAHSGLTDWESLVLDRILRLHCDCMIPYNTYGWELTTVGALIAPTPFLFVNCDDDLGFPMAANRRIAERLKRIYRMYNREDHFQEYVTHGPVGAHSYTPDSRMAIFKWINSHLKKESGPVTDVDDVRFPEEDLRTFPTDADIPRGVLNNEIDQTFVPSRQRCAFLRAASSTRGGKTLSPGCGRCRSVHSRNGFLRPTRLPARTGTDLSNGSAKKACRSGKPNRA